MNETRSVKTGSLTDRHKKKAKMMQCARTSTTISTTAHVCIFLRHDKQISFCVTTSRLFLRHDKQYSYVDEAVHWYIPARALVLLLVLRHACAFFLRHYKQISFCVTTSSVRALVLLLVLRHACAFSSSRQADFFLRHDQQTFSASRQADSFLRHDKQTFLRHDKQTFSAS